MDRLQVFYYNLYAVLLPTCPVRTGNMQRHITFAEHPDYLYVKIEAPIEKTGYDYALAVNEGLAARVTTADFNEFKTTNDTAINAKADAANVYTKDAADAKFMTQDQVDARLNTLIDGANSEDTITNVTNLIEFVNDNAGDIAQLVTDVAANKAAAETNASAIAANKAAHEKNANDIAVLTTAVAAQKVIDSTEITTSAVEGGVQLGIKEVNVSKLVQSEGDILILNGGSATV
jgi:hypothetical protein